MASLRRAAVAVSIAGLAAFGLVATAQVEYRYVERATGGNQFALGYPPPVPQDSATPFDGFRAYAALHARHQDLMLAHDFISGQVVGESREGRAIWAYVLGDADGASIDGGAESSALVSGGVHAREWGSPELTTGLLEAAAVGVGDDWLFDYVNDNVRLVVLPVANPDGFVQTQRYPDRVLVGADPGGAGAPRDGRMRRKNMLGADGLLQTLADHLAGVDLNRNHEPYWASSSRSSADPDSLVYHGLAPGSEPETAALLSAGALADTRRLRWYEDVHSFTQVLFSVNTFNGRRNAVQAALLDTFSAFHDGLSRELHGFGRAYPQQPSPPGVGIGVAAEYFAYTFEIPSWTLEIEPRNGGEDYGGPGTEHDGFILPNSEVARLRDDMALTHWIVAYRQAGPPSLRRLRVLDGNGQDVHVAEWVADGAAMRRLRVREIEPLVAGRRYIVRIAFDKPMRWHRDGAVGPAPGHDLPLEPSIRFAGPDGADLLPVAESGRWLGAPGSDFLAYRFDTFEFELPVPDGAAPDGPGRLRLHVETRDLTGQALDADPSTRIDWRSGRWTGYDGPANAGGPDSTLSVPIVDAGLARPWLLRRGDGPPASREDAARARARLLEAARTGGRREDRTPGSPRVAGDPPGRERR